MNTRCYGNTIRATHRAALILSVALGLAACAQNQAHTVARTSSTANYEVVIDFNASGCPVGVSTPATPCVSGPPGFCVGRGKSIRWRSEPSGNAFEIYFDPFVGRPYRSQGEKEQTPPLIIRRDAAMGEYKYGVYGISCSGSDPVLDPPLRIDH